MATNTSTTTPVDLTGQGLAELLQGGEGNDTLVGSDANKRLEGGAGNDLIKQGRATQATLLGGAGNDRLEVEGYGNTLWGGAGQDTYVIGYYSSGSIIEVHGGEPQEDSSDLVDLRRSTLTQRLDGGERLGSARIDIVDGRRELVLSRKYYPDTADVLRIRNVDDPQLSALQLRLDDNSPFTLAEMLSWAETGVLPNNVRPVQWVGTDEADVLNGGDSDDTLIGLAGADTLNSRAGNDLLIGGDGDDVLNFGSGRGVLVGGDGADTYTVGSFQSTAVDIVEAGADHTGLDVLKLSDNLSTILVKVSGSNLVIEDYLGRAKTTVKDFFSTDPALRSGIDRYDLEDYGSGVDFSFTPQAMAGAALGATQGSELESDLLLGGSAADNMQGGSHQAIGFQDFVSGGAGNDTIRTFSGALVNGGDGDDAIEVLQFRGDTGKISVTGGAGNDTITVTSDHLSGNVDVASVSGGAGSDLVVIKSERALVTVGYGAGDRDKVLLVGTMADGLTLTASDVRVRRSTDDSYRNATYQYQLFWNDAQGQTLGHVTLNASPERVDTPLVSFTDGTSWTRNDLDRLTTLGTAADDDLIGTTLSSDLLLGGAGNDYLAGFGGRDTYDGGAGDDDISLLLVGYSDNTVVRFGPGGGHDQVSMNPNQAPRNVPVLLELTGGTAATDWSVTMVDQKGGYGSDYAYVGFTTLTYKPTGESIRFKTFDSTPGDPPLTVRFGSAGPRQTLNEFRQATQQQTGPLPQMLEGTPVNDLLVGGLLNDTLVGLDGNDTLIGGQGNDVIDVGLGDDLVFYAQGDGDDTVVANPFGQGRLHLDGSFLRTDLSLKKQADGSHRLSFGALPGSITFSADLDTAVPMIEVSSGDSGGNLEGIDLGELLGLNPVAPDVALAGTDGADTLVGSFGRDTLEGGAGADLLMGGSNNDIYRGGEGDDLIIDRPSASDPRRFMMQPLLRGGQDTYLFGRGDGVDTVIDTGTSSFNDILQFGDGISLGDIELVRRSVVGALDDRSPVISTTLPQLDYEIYRIKGTSDEIRFTADVAEVSPGPEWLRFADGTVVEASQLLVGAAPPIGMNVTGTDQSEGLAGTTLADTLTGGLGDDTLNGANGSDHYVFSVGDGADLIQEAPRNADSDDTDTLVLRGALDLSELKFSRNIVALDRLRPLTTIDGLTTVHSLVYAYTDTIDLGGGAGQVQLSWLADESTVLVSNDVGQDLGVLEQIKLDNGQSLNGTELLQRVLAGGVSLRGTNYAADLSGSVGNDLVEAGYEADTLSGWAGNDTLRGNGGNDVLIGGLGNDWLEGGTGSDTLKFNLGDGADTMSVDGSDTLLLGAGLAKADVLIGKVGEKVANAVVLQLGKGSTDSVTLAQAGNWNGLQVKLADGSMITGTEIMAEATKPDNLTLNGTTKADKLTGKDGNDTLSGLAGNDTLTGGKGNDSLIGGKGNDTYLFNRGDGQDVIVDNDSTWFNSDQLKLGGATSKQLWLTKAGSNLDIKILGTQDKVTVQNWFAGSSNQVEKITASDGKSLSASKVNAMVNAMASFTPPADAASLPPNAPAALTKLVASSWA